MSDKGFKPVRSTVNDNEDIDSENGKALSNSVVCVLEAALHDCCVDLNDDDAPETSEDHPASMLMAVNPERNGQLTCDAPIDR